jgi:hypothetical protein
LIEIPEKIVSASRPNQHASRVRYQATGNGRFTAKIDKSA